MPAADTVLFAIEAGLHLYGAVRKAYVDGMRGRPLVLPLPRSSGIDWTSARIWFRGDGAEIVASYPRVGELLDVAEPTADQKSELTELYRAIRAVTFPGEPENDGARGLISQDELVALVTVRQWASGRYGPNPTALQQVGGTLVNLAIDHFLPKPDAISEKRPEGRALRTLLEVLDTTDFATVAVTDIAPDLLVAVLDSVALHPDLIWGGDKEQRLVESVTRTLAESARRHLAEAPANERAEASVWIQLVARALIKGGAGTVLANPRRFLGVTEGQATLIERVAAVMSQLVIGDDRITFQGLLSAEGLNKIVKAVLEAVARNPEVLKINDQGIRTILLAVARDLEKLPEPLSADLFPDLARLLLEKSAANLDLIWGKRFTRPERHLLLTATRTLLAELARRPSPGSRWTPTLTGGQILRAVETVTDEVIDNPQWLIARAERADPALTVTLRAILASLRKLDEKIVSADTGMAILSAAVTAVGRRLAFLNDLSGPGADVARPAITAALDAIFETVFGDGVAMDARWKLSRNSALVAVVEAGLAELARVGLEPAAFDALRDAVRAAFEDDGPFDLDAFTADLRNRLTAA